MKSTRKLVPITGVAVGLAIWLAVPVRAVPPTVYLSPASQSIPVGGTALVDMLISGLDSSGLGGWIVEFSYNGSLLSIADSDVTFGNKLGGNPADQFVDTTTLGSVYAFDISSLSSVALGVIQAAPQPYVLASFAFHGLSPGTSNLQFTLTQLSTAAGTTLADYDGVGAGPNTANFGPQYGNVVGASITVEGTGPPNNVPDSGVSVCLALAVGVLVFARRCRVTT